MTAHARALATIARQKGEIRRLRALVAALQHYIDTDAATVERHRATLRARINARKRMARLRATRRDEANRKRFERTFDALGRTA